MVVIRLRRMGANQRPFYRIVVADSQRAPKGKFIESIGYYDPNKNPELVEIDMNRVEHWVNHGAQMSNTVKTLIKRVKKVSQEA